MKGLKSSYHIGQKFTQQSLSRTESLGITEAKRARSLSKGAVHSHLMGRTHRAEPEIMSRIWLAIFKRGVSQKAVETRLQGVKSRKLRVPNKSIGIYGSTT